MTSGKSFVKCVAGQEQSYLGFLSGFLSFPLSPTSCGRRTGSQPCFSWSERATEGAEQR